MASWQGALYLWQGLSERADLGWLVRLLLVRQDLFDLFFLYGHCVEGWFQQRVDCNTDEISAVNSGPFWTDKLFLTKIFLQNYHNLHRWHKRRPANVLLMIKGVYTWTCLLCIKFKWEYPGWYLKVIFPKKNNNIMLGASYNKLQLKGDVQENKLLRLSQCY